MSRVSISESEAKHCNDWAHTEVDTLDTIDTFLRGTS